MKRFRIQSKGYVAFIAKKADSRQASPLVSRNQAKHRDIKISGYLITRIKIRHRGGNERAAAQVKGLRRDQNADYGTNRNVKTIFVRKSITILL